MTDEKTRKEILKAFDTNQDILDDKELKLNISDLREWAGDINFAIKRILEDQYALEDGYAIFLDKLFVLFDKIDKITSLLEKTLLEEK